jgi:hypothetical protein
VTWYRINLVKNFGQGSRLVFSSYDNTQTKLNSQTNQAINPKHPQENDEQYYHRIHVLYSRVTSQENAIEANSKPNSFYLLCWLTDVELISWLGTSPPYFSLPLPPAFPIPISSCVSLPGYSTDTSLNPFSNTPALSTYATNRSNSTHYFSPYSSPTIQTSLPSLENSRSSSPESSLLGPDFTNTKLPDIVKMRKPVSFVPSSNRIGVRGSKPSSIQTSFICELCDHPAYFANKFDLARFVCSFSYFLFLLIDRVGIASRHTERIHIDVSSFTTFRSIEITVINTSSQVLVLIGKDPSWNDVLVLRIYSCRCLKCEGRYVFRFWLSQLNVLSNLTFTFPKVRALWWSL